MDHWGKGGFLSQEDSKHQEGSADGPFLTSQGEAASHSPWNLQYPRCQQIQCELWNWDVPNQFASSLIYKKPKNSCISGYISHKALSAIFSVGNCILSQHEHWDDDHSSDYGEVTEKVQRHPHDTDSLVCPVGGFCQTNPHWDIITFSYPQKQVVWLGKFFFSIMLLNWRPLNMTKSAGVCEE